MPGLYNLSGLPKPQFGDPKEEKQHEMGWKHILGFVTNSLIAGCSLVPPGQRGIYDHRVYTLLHWWVVITATSLEGLKASLENNSSSLRKAGDPAWHPTTAAGWAQLQDRQTRAPTSPGDAHNTATTEELFVPPAHPAKQAELRSRNTALETASHPSAPPPPNLDLCSHRRGL